MRNPCKERKPDHNGEFLTRLAFAFLRRLPLWLLLLAAFSSPAQSLRFYTMPYRVYEGQAILFIYLDRTNGVPVPGVIPRTNIVSWQWDYRSSGHVDDSSSVSTNIDSTWYAVFDASRATNGVDTYKPTLTVTYINSLGTNCSLSVTGITETMYGLGSAPTTNFFVLQRGAGNQDIQLAVSANPRLGTPNQSIQFFVTTTLLNTNASVDQQNGITWYFGDGGTANGSYVPHAYTNNGLYDVALHVTYTVGGSSPYTNTVYQTNSEYIDIVSVPTDLELGRAYRRGFPQSYDWNDIIQNYNAQGSLGNNADDYIYYHHFETAFWGLWPPASTGSTLDPVTQQSLAETVNEILQGQSLVGNQRLIDALRVKYPKLLDPNQTNATDRLPTPPGARAETAAIEGSLLDYLAALPYPFFAVQRFGTGILRSRATPGMEPFPDFPLYLTIIDPTLSQQPIPIKNEYWQLSALLEKMALGKVEEATKLFNLSASDSTATADSLAACKTAGTQGYLGMALLAAAQSPDDFAANQGNSILADIQNARALFNNINAGVKPLGENNSFVPNESFTAIFQDAQSAVATARQAEIDARNDKREYDQDQATLRDEQQSEREDYITPLVELTGLDPSLYNNLQTVNDQMDYRSTINQEVQALLASYPNASPSGLGQYGGQVIAVLDAAQGIQEAINNLNNLYETIKIQTWANDQITLVNGAATRALSANDIAKGYANAFSYSAGVSTSFGLNAGVTFSLDVSFNPGSILSGYLDAADQDIQFLQQAQIADIQLESQIRQSLLQVANLAIAIRRSKDAYDQAKLTLDQSLAQMNRLIEDLANARDTAANLYFEDPSFRVVVSDSEYRADSEMDFALDRLYRLAKTLEYEWTEGYQNPVQIPVYCGEPASLENPLFDQFTQIDDLFIAKDADEAGDYLSALQAWDSKLRRINGASVRGPNHAGPLTAVPISVREQILGFKTTGPTAVSLDQSIQEFRAYLQLHRQTNYWNQLNPTLQLEFSTEVADNAFFPATGSQWNMRIASISVDLLADQGFTPQQVANVGLIESGMASLRTFWANPPEADQLFKLTFDVGNPNRTAFGIIVPADINGATGGLPASEFINTGLADRPIAATGWILTIDTSDPYNASIDFTKLQDIIIRFTYTYGNPPEFSGF
ncbi:MAG: PKD domain-containing protein [Limisphaerales bacterium]